jgi:hypothetical protein
MEWRWIKTFLTEMSNLSPPIIYPPPSALKRSPAGPESGGASDFLRRTVLDAATDDKQGRHRMRAA